MEKNNTNNIWITQSIKSFIEDSIENNLSDNLIEKAWESPLVGFSRGDDELYSFFKEDIGDFYWTPYEIFTKIYPDIDVMPHEISVISWILPHTKNTKEEQRKDKSLPTKRAVLARVNGDKFNKKVAEFVVDFLRQKGYIAFSPMLSTLWEHKKSDKYSYASTWSERHTSYACGLGTFGLSDALITPIGKAMRCGSVIAKIDVNPTKRSYSTHNEYCLYYKSGGCMKCAERCPANSISSEGHDKHKCREYQRNVTGKYIDKEYNIESRYCGICQFGVPCESGIPSR